MFLAELTIGALSRKLLMCPTHRRRRATLRAREGFMEPFTTEKDLDNAKRTFHTKVGSASGSGAHAHSDVHRETQTLNSLRTVRLLSEPFGSPASRGWALRGALCLIHCRQFKEGNHG